MLTLLTACGDHTQSSTQSSDQSSDQGSDQGSDQSCNPSGGIYKVWTPSGTSLGNIILHQGHSKFDGCGDLETLVPVAEKFSAAGYTVYGMEMPPKPHEGKPLTDFTTPVENLINTIYVADKPIYMVGLSGGGWTTTVITAMDTRITRGYSVAGDMPMEMRTHPGEWGDYEQSSLGIDYRVLYSEANAVDCRRLLHIYNHDDQCCFATIYHTQFIPYGYPWVDDDHNLYNGQHMITDWASTEIIEDIEGIPTSWTILQ